MNQAIDGLIESARLLGCAQAKRGFGVYTQDDAIMERSCWEGVEARAKAIRDEVAAIKTERDAAMKDAERYRWLTRTSDTNKFMVCDTDTQILYFGWEADEAIDAAIAKAEGGAA